MPNDTSSVADTVKPNNSKLILTASVLPATVAGVAVYLNHVWWKGDKIPFHFTDTLDWKYALKLDKAGHFWSCMVTTDVMSRMIHWAGVPYKKALWIGVGSSVLLSTIVEFKDAYSPWWGFSVSDLGADILGSFYPLVQEQWPVMQNFDFKWSYDFVKSSFYSTTPFHSDPSFLDDYERHNYWLTVDVCNLFLNKNKTFQPDFLNLGIGVSAEWLDGRGHGQHEVFLAVDLDLTKLNLSKSRVVKTALHYLNYFHLPAPAVKIKPHNVWYGMTF